MKLKTKEETIYYFLNHCRKLQVMTPKRFYRFDTSNTRNKNREVRNVDSTFRISKAIHTLTLDSVLNKSPSINDITFERTNNNSNKSTNENTNENINENINKTKISSKKPLNSQTINDKSNKSTNKNKKPLNSQTINDNSNKSTITSKKTLNSQTTNNNSNDTNEIINQNIIDTTNNTSLNENINENIIENINNSTLNENINENIIDTTNNSNDSNANINENIIENINNSTFNTSLNENINENIIENMENINENINNSTFNTSLNENVNENIIENLNNPINSTFRIDSISQFKRSKTILKLLNVEDLNFTLSEFNGLWTFGHFITNKSNKVKSNIQTKYHLIRIGDSEIDMSTTLNDIKTLLPKNINGKLEFSVELEFRMKPMSIRKGKLSEESTPVIITSHKNASNTAKESTPVIITSQKNASNVLGIDITGEIMRYLESQYHLVDSWEQDSNIVKKYFSNFIKYKKLKQTDGVTAKLLKVTPHNKSMRSKQGLNNSHIDFCASKENWMFWDYNIEYPEELSKVTLQDIYLKTELSPDTIFDSQFVLFEEILKKKGINCFNAVPLTNLLQISCRLPQLKLIKDGKEPFKFSNWKCMNAIWIPLTATISAMIEKS